VIADAALFTFSSGNSLRLDIILYSQCLGNVTCAAKDEVCGPDDQCHMVMPQPFNGEPDLAAIAEDAGTVDDLSVPQDLIGADLTFKPDLIAPPDMTLPDLAGVDLMGCVPQCAGKMCGFDGCQSTCGTCAPTGQYCDPTQNCASCGGFMQTCCPPGVTPKLPIPPPRGSLTSFIVHPNAGGGGPMGSCLVPFICDINNTCQPPPDMFMPNMDMFISPPDGPPTCGGNAMPCCMGGGPPCPFSTNGLCFMIDAGAGICQ
jgi:hypothetical protein